VSLLGQAARHGNSVFNLLNRRNREHTALLITHGSDRNSNFETPVELLIAVIYAIDESYKSLKLLSVCSMLADGLHSDIFEQRQPLLTRVARIRGNIRAYALANLSVGQVLKMVSLFIISFCSVTRHRKMYHKAL